MRHLVLILAKSFNLTMDIPFCLAQTFYRCSLVRSAPNIFDGIATIEGHMLDNSNALHTARMRVVMVRVINCFFLLCLAGVVLHKWRTLL